MLPLTILSVAGVLLILPQSSLTAPVPAHRHVTRAAPPPPPPSLFGGRQRILPRAAPDDPPTATNQRARSGQRDNAATLRTGATRPNDRNAARTLPQSQQQQHHNSPPPRHGSSAFVDALGAASETYQQEYGGNSRRALRAYLRALPADNPERVRFKAFESDNRAWQHYRATGAAPASLASAGLEPLPPPPPAQQQLQQQQSKPQKRKPKQPASPAPPPPPLPQRDYERFLTPAERAELDGVRADVETYRRLGLHRKANRARLLAGYIRLDADAQKSPQGRRTSPAQVLQRLVDAKNAFSRLTRMAQRRTQTGEIPRADGAAAAPHSARPASMTVEALRGGSGTEGSGTEGSGSGGRRGGENLASAMAVMARRRRASHPHGSSSARRRPTMADEFPPEVRAQLEAVRDGYTEYQRRGFVRPETREAFLRGDGGSIAGHGENGLGSGNGNGNNGRGRSDSGSDSIENDDGSAGGADARERAALLERLRSDYNSYMATYRAAAENLKKQQRRQQRESSHGGYAEDVVDGRAWYDDASARQQDRGASPSGTSGGEQPGGGADAAYPRARTTENSASGRGESERDMGSGRHGWLRMMRMTGNAPRVLVGGLAPVASDWAKTVSSRAAEATQRLISVGSEIISQAARRLKSTPPVDPVSPPRTGTRRLAPALPPPHKFGRLAPR